MVLDNSIVDWLESFYGNSAMVFSSLLRGMIIPSPGCELFVADFEKIEVAVTWWLAGNVEGLEILRSGRDPYIYQAASNLGKTYEEVELGVKRDEQWATDARQLGKAQILGCGFGMGAEKFQSTAWDMFRLKLTLEQSEFAVKNYRGSNPAVPELWKQYESAAIAALENAGSGKCKTNYCSFYVKDSFLWVELPSKRRLAYREPQIAWREDKYGVNRKTLEFWGIHPKTKKWSLERTWGGTLTENIVQGTARDLLMPAMLRLEKAGYRALLTVHDEGICERPLGEGSVEEYVKIFCELPVWGEGLPVNAKGWKGNRYRK